MSVTETTVDGIPVFLADRDDGLCSGGLIFRVGWADETLAVRGLTHLVSHLALHQVVVGDPHQNVEIHDRYTHVYAQGSAQQVLNVLNGVCANLQQLPTHRIALESDALRAEEARRTEERRASPLLRYGAQGYGLASFPELGLPGIDADLVQLWADAAFTRENTVAWLAGDIAPGSLKMPLPEGERSTLPVVTSALGRPPMWFRDSTTDTLVVSGVVTPGPAAVVYTMLLGRALDRDLLDGDRISLSASATLEVRDAEAAIVTITADCLLQRRGGALAGAVVDAMARLRWGPLGAAEVTYAARAAAETHRAADATPDAARRRALDRVLGLAPEEPAWGPDDFVGLTPEHVRAVAEELHASALAQLPDLGLDWAGWNQIPMHSPRTVTGTEYPGRGYSDAVLVLGEDGVMVRTPRSRSTVAFDQVAIMQAYEDGGRWLVSTDGFQVQVEPTMYEVDDAAIAAIDAAVDLARVVRLSARRPEDLPRPRDTTPEQDAAASPEQRRAARDRRSWLRRVTGR